MANPTRPNITIDQAIDALDPVIDEALADPTLFITHKGAHLRLKAVAGQIVMDASAGIAEPKVPEVWIAEKERSERNTADPEYLEAVEAVNLQRGQMMQSVYFIMGTTLESVPEGMFRPEDDEWIDDLEALGITLDLPRENRRRRYFRWLTYYCLVDSEIQGLISAILRQSGTATEQAVQQAIASFRDKQERDSAGGLQLVTAGPNGNSDSDNPGTHT